MEITERIKWAIARRQVKFTEHARVVMLDNDLITGDVMKTIRDFEILEVPKYSNSIYIKYSQKGLGDWEMSLEKPLSRREIEELDNILNSQKKFDSMVERAIRGRRIEPRRKSETSKVARRAR